ncbi:MAG TPA: FAD-dependent oxidoreductase [Candidatus Bathyarchaeia archaeon]
MSGSVLIVGSGVGGATIAKELSARGGNVTILEAGAYPKIGTEWRATKFYTGGVMGPGEFSVDKVEILRTIMVGGSSMVTIGNGVRTLQSEFRSLGIDLEEEFREAESELKIVPCPEENMGERTKLLRKASEELGFDCKPMPKYIDFSRCAGCGGCAVGCVHGAKWSSRNYLGESLKNGAKLKTGNRVLEVIHRGGQVEGVKAQTPEGVKEIEADTVILSAGGIGTPIIMQNSGLEAGSHLFADTFVNTFGVMREAAFRSELGMATIIDEFHDSEGYILSPFMEGPLDLLTDRIPLTRKLIIPNLKKVIGVMAKTRDSPNGKVNADGSILKPVPEVDQAKIDKGHEKSRLLLEAAGADPKTIFRTHVRAAHPGGTAAVGQVIDENLETEVSGLYVCDCSAFPDTPGKPPVLTIVALAKYLAKKMTL